MIKALPIFCLGFLLTTHATEDKKVVQDAAVRAANPHVATAIELLSAMKTESSTTLGPPQKQAGFQSLLNINDYSSGACQVSNVTKLMTLWLNDPTLNFLPLNYKTVLEKALDEYSLQLAEEAYYKKKIEISFNDGNGKLFMLILSMTRHPTVLNAIKWEKYIVWSTFEPAPDWMIETHTDCDLLSCDRDDHIVYLKGTVTEEHIKSLVNINLNLLQAFDTLNTKLLGH